MTTLTIPNTISNGAAGDASKVQQNFDAVGTFVNGSLVTDYTTAIAAAVAAAAPIGSLQMFAGAAAPNANWLLCTGQAISRTTYASLFTAISTAFGVGDGSTTFNLPDMRGRVPVGVGTGAGLTARALAATGGAETHTLAATESGVAAHSHGVTDPGHKHGNREFAVNGGFNESQSAFAGNVDVPNANVTTGVTVNNASAAAAASAHNNMQPFIAVNYIIKAL